MEGDERGEPTRESSVATGKMSQPYLELAGTPTCRGATFVMYAFYREKSINRAISSWRIDSAQIESSKDCDMVNKCKSGKRVLEQSTRIHT